jgi:primary-amine oxidase
MMRALRLARTVFIAFGLLLPALAVAHPLDPLTADEIRVAAQVARADGRFASARFASMLLNEPAKADVTAWQPGTTLPRQARLVVLTPASVFELVIDLTARRLVSATERKGVEPSVMMSEFEAAKIVLTHPEFRAALAKRGVTDPEKVFCSPFTAGYFAIPEHAGKRIVKVGCYDLRRTTTNIWGWPIERLYAVVDLRERKVLSVADAGVVPIADLEQNFTEAAAGPLRAARKPTVMAQPQGANAVINGNEIAWGNWRFHARVDGRVGTVISVARWQDGARLRSVLYQGYVSEMFVPYMDTDYGWYSRTYFDTGEYGAGTMATPLKPGIDCPATAAFLPTTFGDDKGEPITTPNALCIFERGTGDPIWRHAEPLNQTYEGRANVELVVRMAAAVGNYDYLFDWVFNDAAEIEARIGATGIDGLKGVATRRMGDATAATDTRYGTLVAPNLVAVNHDHYFNFRLDLDVDGSGNSFNQDIYRPVTLPADSPRRSIYVVEPRIASSEKAAELDTGHEPSKFRVMNESQTNEVGNAVSYEVLVANHAKLLLDPDDWPAKRAGFLQHDLWVTPYVPSERYAGGEYMFQSTGSDGLAVWTASDRPIRNQDIVVWVNIGMHHLTRAEDLPVMPTIWHSFKLRPHNFFNRNPAIDLGKDVEDR